MIFFVLSDQFILAFVQTLSDRSFDIFTKPNLMVICQPLHVSPVQMTNLIVIFLFMTSWQSAKSDLQPQENWYNKGTLGSTSSKICRRRSVWATHLLLRLELGLSHHRPPRLVVDSSVCGRSRCCIPEKNCVGHKMSTGHLSWPICG